MVTENNSLINTFIKGMNSDTSYSMLQEGLYVYANNVRMFQIDNQDLNGQGEVRAIEGIKEAIEEQDVDVKDILASGSIRDIGVVILKHTDNTWSVYTFINAIGSGEHIDSKFGEITTFREIFHSIEETTKNAFDIVCRYEDDDNIKLYIADGEHPIMLLNLYNKEAIEEQDKEEIPVMQTSINSISSHPTVNLFPAKIELVIDGTLKSGMVSYAYRLYSKYGQTSEISPATRMYPVVNKTTFGYEGVDYDKETNVGFRISINIEDVLQQFPSFDHVEVYRIHYSITGQIPKIDMIGDINISDFQNQNLYYDDRNNNSLKSITLEEFNTLSGTHIIPEIIESKNDYMFAAKIKADNSAYISDEIKNWDAMSFSYNEDGYCNLYNYNNVDSGESYGWNKSQWLSGYDITSIQLNTDCFDKNNLMSNTYEPRYDIHGLLGGTGKNINWNFVFRDVLLDGSDDGEDGRIILQEGFSNPKTASEFKSLRRGELYRYGIILYSKNGSKSDVKWIADIRVPEINVDGFSPFTVSDHKLYGKSIGIWFEVNNLPESVYGYEIVRCNRKMSDIKNITQGVLSRPVKMFDNTTLLQNENGFVSPGPLSKIYPYMPTGYITTAWWAGGLDNKYRKSGAYDFKYSYQNSGQTEHVGYYDNFENINTYQFISPETTYLKDSIINELSGNIDLNPINYLFPSCSKSISIAHIYSKRLNDFGSYYRNPYINCITFGRNMQVPLGYGYLRLNKEIEEDFSYDKYYVYTQNHSLYVNIYVSHNNTESGEDSVLDARDKFSNVSSTNVNHEYNFSYDGGEYKNLIPISYGYCKLYEQSENIVLHPPTRGLIQERYYFPKDKNFKINSIKASTEGTWNGIYESDKNGTFIPKYDNNNIIIGNEQYCNYILGSLYGVDVNSEYFPIKVPNPIIFNNSADDTLVASGGRCFVLQLSNPGNCFIQHTMGVYAHSGLLFLNYKSNTLDCLSEGIIDKSMLGTYLCNICHNTYPYGGGSKSAIDSSSYYSYGDFFYKDKKQPKVFNGDCYPTLLEYVSAHKVYGGEGLDKQFCTTSLIYAIPIESNINTFLTNGFEFSRNAKDEKSTNLLIEPSQVSSYLTQDKELYRYNSVYSSYSTHNPYISESNEVKYNANNDCRVYFSEIKTNNENIDSWTTFKASNYIDVDSRYGSITALKDFKNILFFWLENATGRLASKERSVVQDVNNIQLALGTGDILERYDYIDYIHGLHKDQFCLTQSNEALYWFDEHNQAIRSTTDGLSVQDLTVSTGVSNYMNKYEQEDKKPKLFFDKKYNELVSSVLEDKSIIYNLNLRAFTSFTDITFDDSITFNNGTYLLKKDNNGKLHVAQWNCKQDEPTGWDGTLYMSLTYVVNKQPIVTKVFDNQEIVTINKPYSDIKIDKSKYENLNYSWYTDTNKSESTLEGLITDREGNFRYAIPRANNSRYGDRIRGKYMICEIEGKSDYDTSISYILTKFRTSFS